MAITERRPTTATTADRVWLRRDRIAGWALALAWLCLLVTVVGVGERRSSVTELEDALRAGQAQEIGTTGHLLSSESRGFASVEVQWRDGLFMRTATMTQASDEAAARDARRNGSSEPIIVGSVVDHLTALDPEVKVVPHDRRSPTFEAFGWYTPGWVGLAYLVLLVGTLGLIAGPRPWRATRWAWGWLVVLAPLVGVPAYFLFGGPTALFRPRPPGRIWLTGGWAYLLAILLGGAASS